MAGHTVERGMGARQRKAGELQVIELCAQPVIHPVTLRAISRELKLRVIRLRRLKLVRVAAIAIGRHGGVVTQRTILVTGVTFDGGVRAHQREPVVMLLDLLRLHGPATNRVALLTIRAQFSSMNIRVAISAQVADVCEHRLDVALGTGHALMQSTEWIAGRIVVEFGNRPDRLPPIEGVAILTGDVQWSVRTAGG